MSIHFSEVFHRSPNRDGISFWIDLNGQKITCHVPHDLLVREFGAKSKGLREMRQVFQENYSRICEIAKEKLTKGQAPGEIELNA